MVKAWNALLLPDGISARQGASALINPITVLAWSKQARKTQAMVHTAAGPMWADA